MSLSLSQFVTAMAAGLTTNVVGTGGTAPYTYAVLPGGAGGTINATTGLYSAPATVPSNPSQSSDTIQVVDHLGARATGSILIANVIGLFCDIIQNQMGLANGQVYFWDQKINQPSNSGLYIAVSIPSTRPFANNTEINSGGSGLIATQMVNMQATFDIDIISRGPDARDRKEEVIMALGSIYSESQQELNSFYIAKLPPNSRFVNLSLIDGAAIPYRFKISVNVQYVKTKSVAVPYLSSFQNPPQVFTNP